MAGNTKIEWTDEVWNPVVGCTVHSAGCTNCYAMRHGNRLGGNAKTPQYHGLTRKVNGKPVWTGEVRVVEHKLTEPLRWRKPRRVFVNSMGDLFHEGAPDEWVDRVFDVMERSDRHEFQVLTKRSERLRDYANHRYADRAPPPHVWMGVSVEDASQAARIHHLRDARCAVRFLSVEPLLGPLGGVDLDDIHWVIVGGESGPGFRAMEGEWARDVRDQCARAGVPFFFKQWGGRKAKDGGRALDGREWDQMPVPPGERPVRSRSRAVSEPPIRRRSRKVA